VGVREKNHTERDPRFPHRCRHSPSTTAIEVSPDGKILREWSIDDLLVENEWGGMLHLGSLKNTALEASGDLLHLNDVEPFPSTMTPGFFGPGDVLVSLRNVNTVFVFNADTRKIKFVTTGRFTRQHDPDFIDGNRFSVFDNMGVQPGAKGPPEPDRDRHGARAVRCRCITKARPRHPFLHRYHGETSVAAQRQPAHHRDTPRPGVRDQPAG
jgi:hypothetical protein